MATEITCIVSNPDDPYLRIDRVGGTWGTKSEDEVITEIEAGIGYSVEVDGALVDLIIARPWRSEVPAHRSRPDQRQQPPLPAQLFRELNELQPKPVPETPAAMPLSRPPRRADIGPDPTTRRSPGVTVAHRSPVGL